MIFRKLVMLDDILFFFSRVTNMGPLTNKQQVAGGLWVKLFFIHYRKETSITDLLICAKNC